MLDIVFRIIRVIPVLALIAVLGFFAFAAPYADSQRNRLAAVELPPVDSMSQALHSRLIVVDLHADALLWPRSLTDRSARGHVDLPRLIQGNVAVQLFGAVTQVPPGQNYESNPADKDQLWMLAVASRWPVRTWSDVMQRAMYQASRFEEAARSSRGRLVLVRTREDLDLRVRLQTRGDTGTVSGLLALEGLQALEGNLARLDTLFLAGYRVAGLTHFTDNAVGGSSAGEQKGGLTPFGRSVVGRMESLGMIIDLAHASPALINDVLDLARRPVIVSHTGVQGTCPGPRNLSDDAIRRIAKNGGVIGIGFWDAAVCDITPAGIAKAMMYVADLVGSGHIALGSDFDGATTTAFDASQLVQITHALRLAGFSDGQIEGMMGGNALRVLRAGLPNR